MGACQSAVIEADKGVGADDVHIKLDHAAAPVGLRHAAREEPALGEFAPVVLTGGLALPHDDDVAARAAARAFAAEVAREHGQPVRVEGAEHRATTLRELGLLVEHVKQHSRSWVGRRWSAGAWREVRGLKPEEVNLYDVNLNLLARLGAELGISFSELFARGQERKPKVFLSHAWSHSLLQTYEALVQHAKDRGYGEDEPIWICAFAIRQHAVELGAIMDSPFLKALRDSAMTLIIVAAEGEGVLDRSWCALEMNLAMVEGGAGYLTDIYTHHEGEVQRLTEGSSRLTKTMRHGRRVATGNSRSPSSSAPSNLRSRTPRRPCSSTATTSCSTCSRQPVPSCSTRRCALATLWPRSRQSSRRTTVRR